MEELTYRNEVESGFRRQTTLTVPPIHFPLIKISPDCHRTYTTDVSKGFIHTLMDHIRSQILREWAIIKVPEDACLSPFDGCDRRCADSKNGHELNRSIRSGWLTMTDRKAKNKENL